MGSVVIGYGIWRWIINIPGHGSSIVIEGRYSNVKTEHEGKWEYILMHASVPVRGL